MINKEGRRVVLGLAVATSLAAGCSTSGPTPPDIEPQRGSKATATSTPTAGRSAVPPEAVSNDPIGAAAFVKYWFHTLEHAYATLDTQPLRDASAADCGTCQNLIDAIETVQGQGRAYQGGQIEVVAASAPPFEAESAPVVDARIKQAELRVVDASGGQVATTPANEGLTLIVILERNDANWVVRAVAEDEA